MALREVRESDLPVLSGIRNDTDLQLALMATPRPNTIERVREWLQRRAGDPNGAFFVVAVADPDAVAGFVQLTGIDLLHRYADFGICIVSEHQGNGVADETLTLLERYARNVLGLRKLVLKVLASNVRAVSFYERSGFHRVGVLIDHHLQNGSFHDVLIMEKKLLTSTGA